RIGTQSGSAPWDGPVVEISAPSVIGYRARATNPYSGVNLAKVSMAPESGKKMLPRDARITRDPLAAPTAASVRNSSPARSPEREKIAAPASTISAELSQPSPLQSAPVK